MPKPPRRAPLVGLTGGMGSGKSTVCRMLQERGAGVVDADLLAREIVAPGEPALEEIRRLFGEDVITPAGTLDRAALARRVFSDPEARADLEAITHPRIAALAERRVERLRTQGAPVVLYEAALIVENDLHKDMDGLIVVAAPPESQLERIVRRDSMDAVSARRRLRAQLPLEEKVRAADWVIDNSRTLADTEQQVDALWRELLRLAEADERPL